MLCDVRNRIGGQGGPPRWKTGDAESGCSSHITAQHSKAHSAAQHSTTVALEVAGDCRRYGDACVCELFCLGVCACGTPCNALSPGRMWSSRLSRLGGLACRVVSISTFRKSARADGKEGWIERAKKGHQPSAHPPAGPFCCPADPALIRVADGVLVTTSELLINPMRER